MMHLGKRWLKSLLVVAFCTYSTWVAAQGSYQWKEKTENGYTYKYVENDPTGSRFYTLKNGLSVILAPNQKEPRIQTYIAVKAGSKTDPATHTGLAHYLEHLLFKGTDKFGTMDWEKEQVYLSQINDLYQQYNQTTDETKRHEIYKKIDSVSGVAAHFSIGNEYDKMMKSMGSRGSNAFTSFEQTVYIEDIPSNAVSKFLSVQAERFRKPIFRIFHTELEAVYEEKNIGMDNDGRKVFETMFAALFPNNNYGKQTVIGTVEHLKNPSLVEIQKYFDNYYVPNNMGIIMAGDFNPDQVIKEIDQKFAYMKAKTIPAYNFDQEPEIKTPIVKNVVGPTPENIMLGYRLPGASHKDAQIIELIGNILTNGTAGLIDLNLVKSQKLLNAYAFPYLLKDYSVLLLQGFPTEGQSLEEVRTLLTGQIDQLKKGAFSDELLISIINNEKKRVLTEHDKYTSIASVLMDNFTTELDWLSNVKYVDDLSKITKADVVKFANNYLKDNYVAVYKNKGEDKSIVKVEKPEITPVEMNAQAQSAFLTEVNNMPENVIKPLFLDYKKDIQKAKSTKYDVLSVENKDNELFRLYYYFETGSWANKYLPIAAEYLEYIGTNNKTSEEISKAFYKLAASFSINVTGENSYISIEGLYSNFDESVKLFDDLIKNCVADENALNSYKARMKQARANQKNNKGQILTGIRNYALYGPKNPFNNELTDQELDNLTAAQLVNLLHEMSQYSHRILYYGPTGANAIAKKLETVHPAPTQFKPVPAAVVFQQRTVTANEVLFAPYDMVQAEVFWVRNADVYNDKTQPTISLFNEYFGGGMGSIVFQTIRESKALAYSTYSAFSIPNKKGNKSTVLAYVGTQVDKFKDAVIGMNELINDLPQSDKAFSSAKDGLRKSLATQRVTQDGILFSYLSAEKMGRDYDMRKVIYDQINQITFNDIKQFHGSEFKGKPYSYCIITKENNLKDEDLEKIGTLKKLTLEEIFGY